MFARRKPLIALTLIAGALALAGCATVERAPPASSVALPPAFILGEGERAAATDLSALLPQDDAAFAELNRRALESAPTLGAALARMLVARGDRVVLFGRRPEPLEGLAAELGPMALAVPGDAARADDLERAVAAALAHSGHA